MQLKLEWPRILLYVLMLGSLFSAAVVTVALGDPTAFAMVQVAQWMCVAVLLGLGFFWWRWRDEWTSNYAGRKPVRPYRSLAITSITTLNSLMWLSQFGSSAGGSNSIITARGSILSTFVLLLLFSLVWRREQSAIYRMLDNKIVGFVVPATIVIFISFFLSYPYPIFGGMQSGTAASWSTQLSLVQQAAKSIDADPWLDDITARPVGGGTRPPVESANQTLEVIFYFVGSAGERIEVSYEDTSPTSTLKTIWERDPQFVDQIRGLIAARHEGEARSLATVTITPREAVARTLPEALAHARKEGFQVSPIVGPNIGATHPGWVVTYWPVNPKGRTPADKNSNQLSIASSFTVDAITGVITEREFQEWVVTATPSRP